MTTFILGTSPTHADAAHESRLILRTLQGDTAHYETDIPLPSPNWPPNVTSAANILRDVATRTGRIEPGGYAQTGVIAYADDQVWSAFVDFAPWAYDATVWNSAGDDIVSLADEGQSIVIRVNRQQYDAITGALGAGRLHKAS
ncbi:hypothetical protein [Kribbella sp. NPDC000426]|uniref:hypothetical protein n=1 Tax=Kribbella sp. NPDC000426 TaxID=3154255 RepID=UPI00332DB3C9